MRAGELCYCWCALKHPQLKVYINYKQRLFCHFVANDHLAKSLWWQNLAVLVHSIECVQPETQLNFRFLIPPIKVQKTETTAQEPPSSPSQAQARVSESPKIPHVELRHVSIAKSNRPVSAPPIKLVIPPSSDPPPSTPPPPATPPPPVLLKTNDSTQKGSYWVTL